MSEFSSHQNPETSIPTLDDVISSFDVTDQSLCMAYSQYLDKPSPKRMDRLHATETLLYDAYGNVLRKVLNDMSDDIDGLGERSAIVACVLNGANASHSQLIAEYTDAIVLPTEKEANQTLEAIKEDLAQAETHDEFADKSLEHFRKVLETDMQFIDYAVLQKMDSPLRRVRDRMLSTGFEVAKIGAGALIGLVVYEKLRGDRHSS